MIVARGLTKRFGKVVALDAVDLDVPRGAALGLVGPAGAGKSTLVRLLAGLTRPTAGTVVIGGVAAGSTRARERLGVLLQDGEPYGWMTAREALAFTADLGGVSSADMTSQVDGIADRLSMGPLLEQRVATLPTPVRARLRIAQALVGEPELVVLDAPFERLDADGREAVLGVLSELRRTTTMVLAGPRLADFEAICDRVAVLEAGRLRIAAGDSEHPHTVAAASAGEPPP
jgi:ABC-type multidrug transport system ATPase subunit